MIRFVFFDVANTLLHKPALYQRIAAALKNNNITVDLIQLRNNHKLLSEVIRFPDKTNSDFYRQFNAELLYSLGIIPTTLLLDDIFEFCTYLPWEAFEDVSSINAISLPKGIISNWDTTLSQQLKAHLDVDFDIVVGSAESGVAKPNLSLYKKAILLSGFEPHEILFVGDSLKLDIEPAQKCGIQAILIDRYQLFLNYKNRIRFMSELNGVIS